MALTVEQLEFEILNLTIEARTQLAQRLLRSLETATDIELKNIFKALMLWRSEKPQNVTNNRNKTRQQALEDLLWLSHHANSRRGDRVLTREKFV